MSGKWLELLKEIAPGVTRVTVLRDPAIAAGIGQFAAVQTVAPKHRTERRRPAGGWRDRAIHCGIRAPLERRADRDGRWV
jgi:hypothetical protein